jgi:hypothetical protein
MARLRNVVGRVGGSVDLVTRFYVNGVLFNPYSVSSVAIYNAETGGSLITTLTPTQTSLGTYQATWTIPAGTTPTIYYDRWTWQAQSDMGTQIRTYGFRVDGSEQTARSAAVGPLFVTNKEVSFFNHITKELLQRIVGQKVIYYAVSEQHTKTNDLYDEAIKKTVYRPVEVNALVKYNAPTQKATEFTIDTIYSIEVYFHIHELQERKVVPREGDFVKFGTIVYEIEKLTRPQIVYGQMNNEVMVKAECRVSRKSQFEVLDNIPGY